jgi:hypothetical protein
MSVAGRFAGLAVPAISINGTAADRELAFAADALYVSEEAGVYAVQGGILLIANRRPIAWSATVAAEQAAIPRGIHTRVSAPLGYWPRGLIEPVHREAVPVDNHADERCRWSA